MHVMLIKYLVVLKNGSTSIFSKSIYFKFQLTKMSPGIQFSRRQLLIHLEYQDMLQKAQLSKHKPRNLP